MSNGRNKGSRNATGRDGGAFIALPCSVMDCPAYARLSHPARSLLWEVARQFLPGNNGRLLLSGAFLTARGWKSADVITRAKRELLEAGFIFETVKGHRPNKASWYAVTWQTLEKLPGYDFGAAESFKRSAYRSDEPLQIKQSREELYDRWRKKARKNAPLTPSGGVERPSIAPSGGVERVLPTPPHGAIRSTFAPPSTPSHGNHLDMPSPVVLLAVPPLSNVGGVTQGGGDFNEPIHAICNSIHSGHTTALAIH